MRGTHESLQDVFVPGKLIDIGPAVLATGGAVANTGLALFRLGIPARLMGKIGDDWFGQTILGILRQHDPSLAEGMIVSPGEASSYSVVINPPGIDRMFLHCTGANDTFASDDVSDEALRQVGLFHFGYPPLMRRMYEDDGTELALLMQRAKRAGATTSLDLARPDPASDAGRADWRNILKRVLPSVDLFLPSIEEIMFMLRREQYDTLSSNELSAYMNAELLSELTDELIGMGAAVVALKLGEYGLYLRTTSDEVRLAEAGRYAPGLQNEWAGRELYAPCFKVSVAGTTGAGDCTIAGFLAGFAQGLSPEETMIGAVGTGACNVERPDSVSGIVPWEALRERVAAGWRQHGTGDLLSGFEENPREGAVVWSGPNDAKGENRT
ncbi:carbohydrate kinase family protein [Cohnella terricola]|uniref:Carbohydrate kinase family protein n=2 Tax=Cohnella terricola TaxID=1289167 RepID=A0A559JH54_9BACL|nr:carbohydrate kinase family protein [Cohnella terricola]